MRSFLVAVTLLSVLPIPYRALPSPDAVARSRFWFPLAGLLLGGLLGGWAALLLVPLRSPVLVAFLILVAWVVLTGALHLDGFCDVCDGVLGGRTTEDRLRILKDPHLGTFGLAGGVLLLLGKFVLLQELASRPAALPWTIAAAVTVARCLVLCVAAGARYPRPEGTGKVLIEATRPWEGIAAAVLAAAAVLLVPGGGLADFAIRWLPPLLVVLLVRVVCVWRLDGITGDCLGAAIETAEVTCLLAANLTPV